MDIPALVTAIVFASIYTSKQKSLSKQESLSKQPVAAGGYPSEPDGPTGGSPSEPAYPTSRQEYREQQGKRVQIWPIVKESLQGSALSALLLGIALGMLTEPESVFDSFYEPLFRGLLSVLMLVMGMEAWARLSELFKVAEKSH